MDDTKQGFFLDPLSERELEILRMLEGGCTNREIAQKLVLSLETIKRIEETARLAQENIRANHWRQ